MMKWTISLICGAFVLTVLAGNCLAEDAQANWDKQCAKCHGKDGKGDTKMGAKLKVRDYTDAKVQEALKDDEMTKTIKEGKKDGSKTLMKAYGASLSDDEVKALVAFVRKLKK